MIEWSNGLPVYILICLPERTLPVHSSHMTGVFHKARHITKASENGGETPVKVSIYT